MTKRGQLAYPSAEEAAGSAGARDLESAEWAAAAGLEYGQADPIAAAEAYGRIAESAATDAAAAQATVARARCLARAGQRQGALEALAAFLARPTWLGVRDARGRCVAPSALLMALELMEGPGHEHYEATLALLVELLNDYSDPVMPPSQRLFVMRRLRQAAPRCPPLLTLEAEELAARYLAAGAPEHLLATLSFAGLEGLWRLPAPDRRAVALLRTERVAAETQRVIEDMLPAADVAVEVLAPDQKGAAGEPFLVSPAGEQLPGWQLALRLKGADPFSAASRRQVALYLWTGFLMIGATSLLIVLVGRHLLREIRLTRLKNDFIATVSHELKTPLASMRVLVDTLLEGRYRDQQQVREYLGMLASENERLSRLIDNFLCFSRMERRKQAFDFVELSLAEVARTAADVVRGRFESGGCRFEVEIAPGLPHVMGDRDALVTVLLNLLDNAYKYSHNDRRVTLRAYAQAADVCLEVEDNGIGMSGRVCRRVFEPFYQADRSLSRGGSGCGLGLSIVKFIVDSHGGTVGVQSRPDHGSKFTVRLPALERPQTKPPEGRLNGTGSGPDC